MFCKYDFKVKEVNGTWKNEVFFKKTSNKSSGKPTYLVGNKLNRLIMTVVCNVAIKLPANSSTSGHNHQRLGYFLLLKYEI